MFKSILHEHNGRKAELRRQGEKTRIAAIKSAEALASTLVEAVDSEVSQAFELEKQLSKEAKEARALAVKFKDQTSGWIAAACRADAVLREFGDAEQYLRVIEGDMRDVARMLQQLNASAAERRRARTGASQPKP
ncbi:probable biogenesis of lysosome-related organelles complex 1 subunit [Coccomyxa sp. Obi]|nr:probable biogenesis of lysosome-related organelles complex 1 subunit [Coccomyxa sp. Obi]